MSDVQFDEDPDADLPVRRVVEKKHSLFERMVLATKLANDPKGAQRVMLIVAIIFFVISFLIFIF